MPSNAQRRALPHWHIRQWGRYRRGPAVAPILRQLACALAALVALTTCGCHAPYLLRAAYEEARILSRREPIPALLATSTLEPPQRAKLELVLAVRTYAADRLGLRVGGSYGSLAQTDERQIVHTVTAARRDRLEFYTWWFPIVGRVPYRGFFDRADADALAASLERDGYDAFVRPAVAFSTLGWFDDPLLSHLLRFDDVTLAGIIIHELLHNTIYVAGQTQFNESFADFVGLAGAAGFFADREDAAHAEVARAAWADEVQFSRFLDDFVDDLANAYAHGLTYEERTKRFTEAQRAYAALPRRTARRSEFADETLNNAKILHYQLYAHRLDVFDRVAQRYSGDLKAAITWIKQVAINTPDPFKAVADRIGEPA